MTHHVQFRAQQRAGDLSRREALYKSFIEDASKWHADTIAHDQAEVANLVNLYSLVSGMRILSSPGVVENAERVVRVNKIKLRAAGYRLAYEVFDDAVVVMVLAVGKRERGEVYKKLASRIQNEH
jgi:hypothetical protein